jgi:hypothetical protein
LTPAEHLEAAGRALYGARWHMRLSRDLDLSKDTISRWLLGRVELRPTHPVFIELRALLRAKARDLARAADDLDAL